MLIYVNQLKIIGDDALLDCMMTVSGWLKQLTGEKIPVPELCKPNDFAIGRQKVRTYNAIHAKPELHSILFSNPDSETHGRQWITEIGMRVEDDGVLFTILLETSDISTQVTTIPNSSRPKVIKYLQENCVLSKDTVGLKVLKYSDSTDQYRGLLSEIERPDRTYPLVIVSSDENSPLLFNVDSLQEQLVGLAQVITNDGEIDTWEMERVLGRRYAIWGGGINIVFPLGNRYVCPRRLILKDQLLEWKDNQEYIIGEVLSIITHTTNGHRKRVHFSPYDVRAKRQKDHASYLKTRFEELQESGEFEELLNEAFKQIDEYENTIEGIKNKNKALIDQVEMEKMALEDSIEELEDNNRRLTHSIDDLKYRVSQKSGTVSSTIDSEYVTLIMESISICPTPEDCLRISDYLYPDRIVILKSAYSSAKESSSFKQTRKLIGLISKLCTEYIDALKTGGDSKAKSIFGSAYSANESETVERSPKLSKLRTFTYKGQDTPMFKHLRIGNADNVEETIRVHFHWDSVEERIIIGYCGKHLPIRSKSH